MTKTIDALITERAHQLADRIVNRRAEEAAQAAWAEVESEIDPQGYNPEKRALILDRAQNAADAARENVQGEHWETAYQEARNLVSRELAQAEAPRPSTDQLHLEEGQAVIHRHEQTRREW
jgi:hypothetical protein